MSVVVFGQQYVAPKDMELVIKEKYNPLGAKDDEFTIKDGEGKTLFKVDANFWTMSQRRTLKDADGKDIAEIRRKKMSMHGRWIVFEPDNEDKILYGFVPQMVSLHHKVDVYLNDGDKKPDFMCKGNWRAKEFQFFDVRGCKEEEEWKLMGSVKKESFYKSMEAFMGRDNYFVQVKAGVDMAFLASLVLLIDETCHDQEKA